MSSRRSAGANRIRGPHSALTDFLASHNISAQQISDDYQRRLREAEEQTRTDQDAEANKENESENDGEDPVERKKRKRKEEMAIMKIKQSKEFKKRKYEEKRDRGSDGEDDDTIARRMLSKSQPMPGQLENCEKCEKRFTVTPYSRTGPFGGLLCTKCSKELKDGEKKQQAQARKKAAPKGRRRQTESDRMMGDVKPGAKSLVEACVRKVADVVNDIEEFGDMPQNLLERLSQILSKKRVLTSRTLQLFLRPDLDQISVYDCGKLEQEDFVKIFTFMPTVRKVNLRFAGQMKDDALTYLTNKCHNLQHLHLGATNLISDDAWIEFFQKRGSQLETLKLSELNDSLRDETVVEIFRSCKNLKRLKLRSCSHMGEASIEAVSNLQQLQHLTLAIGQHVVSAAILVHLIKKVGPRLKTLCLEGYTEADDSVLQAIRDNCANLNKFRFTNSYSCSDMAFADLFENLDTAPLSFVDMSENRDIDNANPEGPQDNPIGFGSGGLAAVMRHSGDRIEKLDLHSCRHISHQALTTVFDGRKQYPLLRDIDLSFITMVDEVVINGIFKSCPSLSKLAVFACFNARQVKVPTGVAVIGLPNAQDHIIVEGNPEFGA